MEERDNKIANTISVKMSVINEPNICISALNLPSSDLCYLQSNGYNTAQDLFQASAEEFKKLRKYEKVLNSLHDIGIYYIWEDSYAVKKNNVVLISDIGLSEREKRALLRNNITTIVELEIFIKTRTIDRIKRYGGDSFKGYN